MIKSFKIENGCFGTYIEINDVDIFDVYYSQSSELNIDLDKEAKQLKRETLELLLKNVDKLHHDEWVKIIDIVSYHEGFKSKYNGGTACGCCGTYDETTTHSCVLNAFDN